MIYYLFDGSYYGYLTAFFQLFKDKNFDAEPSTLEKMNSNLFAQQITVDSDAEKAKRIITGLELHIGTASTYDFYKNFLSEDPIAWRVGFKLMLFIFKDNKIVLKNYAHPDSLYFSQTVKKMGRESHRMKAFIRFSKSEDELYSAVIEPDFNVLPLIISFFKRRFTDQRWLIYDLKRDYGYLYDLNQVQEVTMAKSNSTHSELALSIQLDKQELHYQKLWKAYFRATNIVARKNMKLHLQHVPKRYWKYLVEKQG
ncbi:DUF4130 domain-containing protein [Sphingobacterium sp. DK4209]|uniref:DUF4130 domain-containing protein n=1 Tax=Sphingobacterium zhuxiongii TaxID=2662364 RepID=A0A5Q0QAM8_9SPHI|nr:MULTISPECIES: TIGR03915 family putative DNA repair protein [unclassified Sphingobacterium]MVZ64636.1 DUF4130 domain-containing protein [Sphingobacterium sp. DK4209]QGA26975.1 DUF4130 domain-containing protein [Sphingobacterium sp. dk4302]